MNVNYFHLRIAFLNSLGLCFLFAKTTIVDAALESHMIYSSREYTLGLNICWFAIILFIISIVPAFKNYSENFMKLYQGATLLIFGTLSLPYFMPEFPHMGIFLGVISFCLVGTIASIIHHHKIDNSWMNDIDIEILAKIERIKEYSTFWRSFAMSLLFGYIGILISASETIWKLPDEFIKKPEEAILLTHFDILQLILLSVYMLIGPIWESFNKAITFADKLLELKSNR